MLLTTSLAAQTQIKYPMLQIKPISKNTFRLSPSSFFAFPLLPNKLGEETTQRKHSYVTLSSSLTTKIVALTTNILLANNQPKLSPQTTKSTAKNGHFLAKNYII